MTMTVVHVVGQTGERHSSELQASVCGGGVRVQACRAVGGTDSGPAGSGACWGFPSKSLVPQGGQLWISPAAVQGTLK